MSEPWRILDDAAQLVRVVGVCRVTCTLQALSKAFGIDALRSTFVLMGIVLLVAGVALVGYGLMIRNAPVSAPTDDD